jgi:mRNA-degrading endonuclease RelE of RelBE toxin-antitoxin system
MSRVAIPYELEWDPVAEDELNQLRSFDARSIVKAIRELRYGAEMVTRNRKPLTEPLPSVPEATWELRVGEHRVLYEVRKHRIVRMLRVILKGRLTMDEAASGSRRE